MKRYLLTALAILLLALGTFMLTTGSTVGSSVVVLALGLGASQKAWKLWRTRG